MCLNWIGAPVNGVEPESAPIGGVEPWRLVYIPARTLGGPVIPLQHIFPLRAGNPKPRKTYRNPIIFAQELVEEISREELSQAELTLEHGLLKACVN